MYKNNVADVENTTVLTKPARAVNQSIKNREKMASRDLEKEFDPTQWSSRFDEPKELLQSHVEFGNQGEFVCSVISVF